MSKTLRMALAVEGKTDSIMLEAIISGILQDFDIVCTRIQPLDSSLLQDNADENTITTEGWPGIYHWCKQTSSLNYGVFENDILFKNHDLLLVHLDADVAEKTYQSGHIMTEHVQDLPCEQPCPPSMDTTNALRKVLFRWMGISEPIPRMAICIPSKSIESWILAALYPSDPIVKSGNLECRRNLDAALGSKPKLGRLISSGKKNVEVYRERSVELQRAWSSVCTICPEARRFAFDFSVCIESL